MNILTGSVGKVSEADRNAPRDPSDQDKKESMKKVGPLPESSQRPYNLISLQYFPDTIPKEGGQNLFTSPEILIKLPPDLQTTNGPNEAQSSAMIQLLTPLDVWLFNRLNINDSDLYSSKHNGPLCFKNAYNAQTGEMGPYTCKAVSSVPKAESSTLMKGWHLHAFGPSYSGFVRPTCHYSTKCPSEIHFFTGWLQLTCKVWLCWKEGSRFYIIVTKPLKTEDINEIALPKAGGAA